MKIPYIASEWTILIKPKKFGNYVNDHTIVMGADGKWHLYGITSFEADACNERYFLHGVGDSLDCEFEEVGKTIDRGTLAWAPCVIEKDGYYYMYYGPSPTQMAVSFDMYEWFNHTVMLKDEPLMVAHRDHFVLKVSDGEYLMYVVGTKDKKAVVSLFSSNDMINWQFKGYALTSGDFAPLSPGWGAMESPYVIKKDDKYYLFITYTDCNTENYNDTLVFVSDDPSSFGEYNGGNGGAIPVAKLYVHAPEILESNGKYYITTCGWTGMPTPHDGCVSVANLEWKEI